MITAVSLGIRSMHAVYMSLKLVPIFCLETAMVTAVNLGILLCIGTVFISPKLVLNFWSKTAMVTAVNLDIHSVHGSYVSKSFLPLCLVTAIFADSNLSIRSER